MYQSSIHICIAGLDDSVAQQIQDAVPFGPFTHNVERVDALGDAEVHRADLIVMAVPDEVAAARLEAVLDEKRRSTHVIAVCEPSMAAALEPAYERLADLWRLPLEPAEAAWRFGQWQRRVKTAADAWQNNQFLEATINSIPCLVWYKTKDGVHEKVNDSFCATVNKAKDDVQGRRHAYIWDVEQDDPACIESEEKVMATGTTCVAEETVQTGGGTRLLTTYKSPLYNIDGNVMGTVGVAIDITQERAYEQDLIEKNQTLETIFTAMDCGVLTHSIDGSRVVGVNQAALNILGYSSVDDMMGHGFDMIASSVLDEDKEMLRQKFATLTHVGDSVSIEYRVRHDDGTLVHIMGNVKLIEKDGELLYQRFLLDYSDQKREEERRQRRQQDLVRALSENYLVVCAFNLDTGQGERVRLAEQARAGLEPMFGDRPAMAETLASYIERRVHDDDREALAAALDRDAILAELAERKRFNALYRAVRGDEVEYCQATVVRAGSWAPGEDRFIVLGLRNVDQETREEMKQKELLEEALYRANRASEAKSTFLSNMSHDIRTPMNAIVGFTALANNHMDEREKVSEYLDKIQASSTHLLSLINDILDMSRIESGKVSLDEKPCCLQEALGNLAAILQPEADARKLNLRVDVSAMEHSVVICDELKINQVLLNLLGNAIKFTGEGGTVSLTVTEMPCPAPGKAAYRLAVRDDGIGMTQDFIQHIFDPFERERTSTLSGIQGTGLGMAITKSLVDMMGGTIEVRSEKGVGSEFTVSLAFDVADDAVVERVRAAEGAPAPSERLRGCRILLVDDNLLNREIAVTLLEDVGFKVECAVDGQDAIDKLSAVDPCYFQLVLMDIQMPVMNGYETASVIRAMDDPVVSSIPILAVTADAFEEDRRRALSCGMNGHLAKPIEVPELLAALDEMLA